MDELTCISGQTESEQGMQGPIGPKGADGAPGAAGPAGPAGPIKVSADAGNVLSLGTDGFPFDKIHTEWFLADGANANQTESKTVAINRVGSLGIGIGQNTPALLGVNSLAVGQANSNAGKNSIILGKNNSSTTDLTLLFGENNKANGGFQYAAIGNQNEFTGNADNVVAIGQFNKTIGSDNIISLGRRIEVAGTSNTVVIGGSGAVPLIAGQINTVLGAVIIGSSDQLIRFRGKNTLTSSPAVPIPSAATATLPSLLAYLAGIGLINN